MLLLSNLKKIIKKNSNNINYKQSILIEDPIDFKHNLQVIYDKESDVYFAFQRESSNVLDPKQKFLFIDLKVITVDEIDHKNLNKSKSSNQNNLKNSLLDESELEIRPQIKANDQALDILKTIVNPDNPFDKYILKDSIGCGFSGEVYKAINKETNVLVAVKRLMLEKHSNKNLILNEIQESYMHEKDLWIVMEYLNGGALTDIIVKTILDESQMAYITKECLLALDYLHSQNIIHRDVKSDNVLVSLNGDIKITDFGFCAELNTKNKRSTIAGTIYWMAPEIINKKKYDKKIDIWSLGILLIEMIDGYPPYFDLDQLEALKLIKQNIRPNIQEVNIQKVSPENKYFLDCCLEINPDKRANTKELLKHPFIEKACKSIDLAPNVKAVYELKFKKNTNLDIFI